MRIDRRGFIELTAAGAASAALPGFAFAQPRGTMVTGDSVDPLFGEPVIEVNEMRTTPVPHRYVRGNFKGTPGKFSFYFPAKEQYRGRFFHNTYPLIVDSDVGPSPIGFKINEGNIGFAFDSGGYLVQTNQGGSFAVRQDPDISISSGYRLNAAAAKFSRIVAAEVYGRIPRPYGYIHGGSGGAYQTMGCAENTSGVWDGFLPYVLGSAYTGNCRPYAQYVLSKRNKVPGVIDALDPGGSGDIYAGLNDEERAALREATLMGFPPRGWWQYDTFNLGGGGGGGQNDPTYVEDFWSKPGYLGTDPKSSMRAWRVQYETAVAAVTAGPPATIDLADVPGRDLTGSQLVILSGASAGKSVPMGRLNGKKITVGGGGGGIAGLGGGGGGGAAAVVAGLKPGDRVRIDNSSFLAFLTYHRHTIPASRAYHGYDQFRGADGKPLYPQRNVDLTPNGAITSSGSLSNGRITGKVLAMQSMMDINACAWNADWYRSHVKAALGPRFDDNFALRFTDNAMHDFPGFFGSQGVEKRAWARTVAFDGALQQGLRDLALWVEKGVKPAETRYRMVDSEQVQLPATARERGGIQPVATLRANGGARAAVGVNTPVKFAGTIEVPPGAGKVVVVEWDYEGTGNRFPQQPLPAPQARAQVSGEHSYSKPGTYFPVLRVFSHRQGDAKTPYGQIQNIARARVVVT